MSQTQKERMLAGLPYRANDPELKQIRAENKLRVARYQPAHPQPGAGAHQSD